MFPINQQNRNNYVLNILNIIYSDAYSFFSFILNNFIIYIFEFFSFIFFTWFAIITSNNMQVYGNLLGIQTCFQAFYIITLLR